MNWWGKGLLRAAELVNPSTLAFDPELNVLQKKAKTKGLKKPGEQLERWHFSGSAERGRRDSSSSGDPNDRPGAHLLASSLPPKGMLSGPRDRR